MQLVTYGSQDVYLTGNPQITFFKLVYRRHTNFAMECIEQVLNGGTPTAGGINTCTISNSGDLVHDIWIEDITRDGEEGKIYQYIDNVEIGIGGQLIDRQHGDWNAIWWNLTTPESKVSGYANCFLGGIRTEHVSLAHSFWYPLNFWFCRNVGSAIPLIALQYNEVKLKILWGSNSIVSSNAKVLVDYIFLDTDERRRFAQISHEYLIEQVQRIHGPANIQNIDLNFDHPVKELIWVNDILNSTLSGITETSSSGATCYFGYMRSQGLHADHLSCKLQLNGDDRISYRPARYFKLVQPLKYHTRVPGGYGPIEHIQVIHGRGSHASAADAPTHLSTGETKVIGIFTFQHLHQIVSCVPQSISGSNGSEIRFKLQQGTASHSEGGLSITGATDISGTYSGQGPHTVVPLTENNSDAGTTLAGSFTNASSSVEVTMELIIFDIYYRDIRRLIGGGKYNLANIYVYSFALKPEEHQPSGTCNFSRIDNAKLVCSEDFGESTNTYKIFAVNYNVLRIMSGMAGLAYSN